MQISPARLWTQAEPQSIGGDWPWGRGGCPSSTARTTTLPPPPFPWGLLRGLNQPCSNSSVGQLWASYGPPLLTAPLFYGSEGSHTPTLRRRLPPPPQKAGRGRGTQRRLEWQNSTEWKRQESLKEKTKQQKFTAVKGLRRPAEQSSPLHSGFSSVLLRWAFLPLQPPCGVLTGRLLKRVRGRQAAPAPEASSQEQLEGPCQPLCP